MKITKQRLKEIIKEELENSVFWSQMRLDDKNGPFLVLVPSAPVEERYASKPPSDQLVSLDDAHSFKTLEAAEGVQARLGNNAEVQPVTPVEEAVSPNPTSRRSVDSNRRRKNRERGEDPNYQKVKTAYEKNLKKAAKEREDRGIK